MDRIENLTFDEIKVGDTASLVRTLTYKDIEVIAIMSRGINPRMWTKALPRVTCFTIVAHGMWGAALISTILAPVSLFLKIATSRKNANFSGLKSGLQAIAANGRTSALARF